eukprot:GHVU01022076.1.p3 GENE.GHVU01022076.1~~GHVU01022076.1.p3  ORF type:complete len:103 (+),score=7.82 GHVU01022076.1:136-444(+)
MSTQVGEVGLPHFLCLVACSVCSLCVHACGGFVPWMHVCAQRRDVVALAAVTTCDGWRSRTCRRGEGKTGTLYEDVRGTRDGSGHNEREREREREEGSNLGG